MKLAWVIAVVLFVVGVGIFIDALTTTHGVWLSIPLLFVSGLFTGPGIILLLALAGLYDLSIELNGHRLEFRKRQVE